jgi:hypothetical protein
MAIWESKTVSDIITRIADKYYVLPVIQRRLVWNEEKMELLFDTLLKGNSFGGVMVLEEERQNIPLFASRPFTPDGSKVESSRSTTPLAHEQYFVIDGQQRLQSFYIGLKGQYNGKKLYFNLNSDFGRFEYDFQFANDAEKLIGSQKNDDDEVIQNIWYPVAELYERCRRVMNARQVATEINTALAIPDDLVDNVKNNIDDFLNSIMTSPSIGVSKVIINRSLEEIENKQRIVELFRRLNDGGTRLSSFELVASIMKGFSWEMESFLENTIKTYRDIGIGQDELIKLIFILQDEPAKEMLSISARDAQFAIDHRERIQKTLEAVVKFLHHSKLHTYYLESQRSAIPLYFVAYHVFHQDISDEEAGNYFDQYDVRSDVFTSIYTWIHYSLLSGVFKSKGVGWIPYHTGIKKILAAMKETKGKSFPHEDIFQVYLDHPLHYFRAEIYRDNLDRYEKTYLFYLLYDCKRTVRQQDIDHIHPKSILGRQEVPWERINSVSNYQLLDHRSNRWEKSGSELFKWIDDFVENKTAYLNHHLIPTDEHLWRSENFEEFKDNREELILRKLKAHDPSDTNDEE